MGGESRDCLSFSKGAMPGLLVTWQRVLRSGSAAIGDLGLEGDTSQRHWGCSPSGKSLLTVARQPVGVWTSEPQRCLCSLQMSPLRSLFHPDRTSDLGSLWEARTDEKWGIEQHHSWGDSLQSQVQILVLPLATWVILDKWLKFSAPQFSYL